MTEPPTPGESAAPLTALPPAARRWQPDWWGRALFEGGLIALSIIGAVAVNEWKDARDRQARVRDATAAMRLELRANREEIGRVIRRNAEISANIKDATAKGKRYEGGILRRAQVVSTAWDSARAAAITNDMDFPTLVAVGRAYTLQADYQREVGAFYDALMGGFVGDIRGDPQRMSGVLHDLDENARALDKEYDTALRALPAR